MTDCRGTQTRKKEKRGSCRVTFSRGVVAQLIATDRTWFRSSKVNDICSEAARIQVAESIESLALDEFFLSLLSSGLIYRRCKIAWVTGRELGVNFLLSLPPPTKQKRPQSDAVVQYSEI